MVKQTILIHGIVEKEGKTGNKYYLINTDKGKMSCFPDYSGLKDLKKAYANEQEIEVNTVTSDDGKFVNIRNEKKSLGKVNTPYFNEKILMGAMMSEESAKRVNEQFRKSVKGSAYEKDPVGLAVEVFCAIVNKETNMQEKQMNYAIDLVKQAQEAFS